MAHEYPKEIHNAFEEIVEGFDKDLVMSSTASKKRPDAKQMHRAGDVFWRPQPMIEQVSDGLDSTGDTNDLKGLFVPASLSHIKRVVWDFDSLQLRDKFYLEQETKAARQALAAAVEEAVAQNVAMSGGHVITRAGALTGYDDLALAEASLTEIGVARDSRSFFFNTRDKIGVASNLASRQTLNSKPESAMEESMIGMFAKFRTYDVDLLPQLTAAAATGVTVNGANQGHTVTPSRELGTGEVQNVDNRYQNLTVSSTAGAKAGDAFTLAGVNRVHMITKQDTNQLFTNRIIEVVNGTTLKVLAMIPTGKYQNVSAAPADSTPLVFINTTDAQTNVFWKGNSVELLGGRLAVDEMRDLSPLMGTTDNSGIQIVMLKQSDIDPVTVRYKFLIFFGTANLNPMMNGIMLSNQS